ncbi:MAG: hypothetical protein DMG24_07105 [Acidobacteria bacterium]|nr:MAG: hypothetical protein DMG24_07105 [Acidobacteriota bacterium]
MERPEPAEKCEIILLLVALYIRPQEGLPLLAALGIPRENESGSRLIRAGQGAGRSGWDLRRVYAAVDNKGQMRPFDKDDVLFVGEKAVDQGRASADPCAIKNIAAKPGPAAVPVVAAVSGLSRPRNAKSFYY